MRALPRILACTPLERTTGHKKPLTSTLQKNTHQEVRVFLVRKAAISQKRRSSHNERKNFSAFQTNTHSRKQQHGSALSTQSYFKRRRGKAPKRRFVNLTVEPEALLHPRKPGGRRQAGHAGSEDGHRGKRRAAAQHLSHGFSKPLPQVAGFLFCYATLDGRQLARSPPGPLPESRRPPPGTAPAGWPPPRAARLPRGGGRPRRRSTPRRRCSTPHRRRSTPHRRRSTPHRRPWRLAAGSVPASSSRTRPPRPAWVYRPPRPARVYRPPRPVMRSCGAPPCWVSRKLGKMAASAAGGQPPCRV